MDADRDDDQAEDKRGLAVDVRGDPAEGEQGSGDQQPGQERKARQAGLRGDGDRRVVRGRSLRLLAAEMLLIPTPIKG